MAYRIREASKIAGVSVRTLHYYDQIGLLKPESVNTAGYRFYSESNLEKLQQILFFKELGFSLKETARIISLRGFDRKRALHSHKKILIKKKQRLERIIETVEKTIESLERKKTMPAKEMFNGFDMSEIEKHQKEYAEETRRTYGQSAAYKESQRRTAKYTKEDWARIMSRQGELFSGIAALMDRSAQDPAVQKLVGEWRQHITDSYYNCTLEIFQGLGDLYVNETRFTKNIDKIKPGLAGFLKQAIAVYCDKQES